MGTSGLHSNGGATTVQQNGNVIVNASGGIGCHWSSSYFSVTTNCSMFDGIYPMSSAWMTFSGNLSGKALNGKYDGFVLPNSHAANMDSLATAPGILGSGSSLKGGLGGGGAANVSHTSAQIARDGGDGAILIYIKEGSQI